MPPDPESPRLILGSASPRRAALLHQLGLSFAQVASPEEELALPATQETGGEAPQRFVVASARAKARAVRGLLGEQAGGRYLVIGADTVVVLDDRILGKPAGEDEAAAMLRSLSGRDHCVYTGLALVGSAGGEWLDHALTRVRMRPLSEADITWYVASGEPLDKAGAYGIQGLGARFIEFVEGCYYNVVGLPLERLSALLETAGYRFTSPDPQVAGRR
ncbi:MAG: Maf family protein [Candidatus Latescibacterota bacterium]